MLSKEINESSVWSVFMYASGRGNVQMEPGPVAGMGCDWGL